jgi:hypothetical protein
MAIPPSLLISHSMTMILAHFVINKIVHGGVGFVLGDQAKLRPQY